MRGGERMRQPQVLAIGVALVLASACAQANEKNGDLPTRKSELIAHVAVGTNAPVCVANPQIDFKYGGSGIYNGSDYRATKLLPLTSGITVDLTKVRKIRFSPKKEKVRNRTEMGVEAELEMTTGTVLKEAVNRPVFGKAILIGETEFGGFRYQLNSEDSKPVEMKFETSEPADY